MQVRPLDFLKKICYNKRKNLFYRSGKRGPIGLIFIKKYVIIKVEAIWPIGSGFTGYSGAYARSLSIEKNSIWGLAIGNSVRPGPGRPVHLIEGAYGVLSRIPDRPWRGGVSLRGGRFRENVHEARTKKIRRKKCEMT